MFYLNVADEIGDKIIEILSSNWVTLENETIHTRPPPPPPPSPSKLGCFCCFLQVARTAAQHCMDGMGEENFVADCNITLVHCGRLSRI